MIKPKGLLDSVVKTITVDEDFALYVPNAFTPNDDGINDIFTAVVRGVKNITLDVFNRWGEFLFSSDDPQKAGMAAFKGKGWKRCLRLENKRDFETGRYQIAERIGDSLQIKRARFIISVITCNFGLYEPQFNPRHLKERKKLIRFSYKIAESACQWTHYVWWWRSTL